MTATCTDPTPLATIDPTVNMALVVSPIARADGGVYTWTTRCPDGHTMRYRTNVAGDGLYFESVSDGWLELMSPEAFTVRDCSPATRRRRIVAFLTNEGFEVTTGHVTPDGPAAVPFDADEILDLLAAKVRTDTGEVLDRLAAKFLASPPVHGFEMTLQVGVLATDRIVHFGCGEGVRVAEVHGFVLGEQAVGIPGGAFAVGDGLTPRELVGDLAAQLLLRGVKWDVDGRELVSPAGIPVNTPYGANLVAPVSRATSGYVTDIEQGANGRFWSWKIIGECHDTLFRTDGDGTGVYEFYGDDETPEEKLELWEDFDIGSCSPEERRRRILPLHHC